MNNDLVLVEKSLAEFGAVEAGLVELESKYQGVAYAVVTTKGMADAVAARAEIRAPRINAEKIRKAGKAPILALGRLLDSKASEITARLEAIEAPIDDQIKAEEQRKAAEKAERERIESERVARNRWVIDAIKSVPVGVSGMNSSNIASAIESLRDKDYSALEEFVLFAENARNETIKTLESMHQAALEKEEREAQEAAARKAEQGRLAEESNRLAEERNRLAEERNRLAEAQEELRKAQEQDRIKREAENAEIERRKREQDAIELAAIIKSELEETAHREAIEAAQAKIEADQKELQKQQELLLKQQQEDKEVKVDLGGSGLVGGANLVDLGELSESVQTTIEEIVYLVKTLLLDDQEMISRFEGTGSDILKKLSTAIKKYEASK